MQNDLFANIAILSSSKKAKNIEMMMWTKAVKCKYKALQCVASFIVIMSIQERLLSGLEVFVFHVVFK